MSLPFAAFAQTSTTSVDATTTATTTTAVVTPGLVPGDFFYFLDRWTEALSLALTFNKEDKARKHLGFAKERVAEINKVLENPNAKLDDVASAKDNFDSQIADAAAIVKSEKEAGNDVKDLAVELDDELDMSRGDLKDVFHQHQNDKAQAEVEIRAKIDAIVASGTASTTSANELQGLTQALQSITKERKNTAEEENSIDASVSDEQATFEEAMGKELSAQKHMEQALRLRGEMGLGFQADLATSSEKFMMDAEAAMKRGDFETAKNMSKAAEHAMEKAREMLGDVRMGMSINSESTGSSSENINTDEIDNLERNINDSERMMEGTGSTSNEVRVNTK